MATTTLLCKQCNFENEPERVYCHNCGAKLDRSLLPLDAMKRDDPVVAQDRVRKMMSPKRGQGLQYAKNLGWTLLASVLLAGFIQMVRPPRNIPNISQDDVMSAPTIRDDMESIVEQPSARRLAYTELQVNSFLQQGIRSKTETFLGMPMKFERVYLHLDEGTCRVTKQQSIFGYPLYVSEGFNVSVQNGKIAAKNIGGSLGRLALPAPLMNLLNGPVFGSLWNVFATEQKLIARMQTLGFHKGNVEIISKAGGH